MAVTFAWHEDYGTETGSPLGGTSDWTPATNINWSSNADPSTAYGSNPITAGNNSYRRYQWGLFTGTTGNQVSNGKYTHTAGACDTGISLNVTVTSTYATPVTTALGGTDKTTPEAIGSGITVLFSTDGNPETATPTATADVSDAGNHATQYLVSQIQTTGAAAPGDFTTALTMTLGYDEN